jgi:hypothetical protein
MGAPPIDLDQRSSSRVSDPQEIESRGDTHEVALPIGSPRSIVSSSFVITSARGVFTCSAITARMDSQLGGVTIGAIPRHDRYDPARSVDQACWRDFFVSQRKNIHIRHLDDLQLRPRRFFSTLRVLLCGTDLAQGVGPRPVAAGALATRT